MPKTGFLTPLNDWLKRDKFYNMVKEAFTSETAEMFFDTDYIMNLLDNHKNDKEKNMKRIWSVYSFILWYNKYFVEN